VELAAGLPLRMKLRNGRGKWALRQLLYRHVPANLIDRPKMGFAVPVGEWLRGPLRPWAEELISQNARSTRCFNAEVLHRTWNEHVSGAQDHAGRLWTVLMFQAWLNGRSGPRAGL
jgi:asparagine synthase (glutamine-hydrolysing)